MKRITKKNSKIKRLKEIVETSLDEAKKDLKKYRELKWSTLADYCEGSVKTYENVINLIELL